jgi:hypothetical protein
LLFKLTAYFIDFFSIQTPSIYQPTMQASDLARDLPPFIALTISTTSITLSSSNSQQLHLSETFPQRTLSSSNFHPSENSHTSLGVLSFPQSSQGKTHLKRLPGSVPRSYRPTGNLNSTQQNPARPSSQLESELRLRPYQECAGEFGKKDPRIPSS